MVNKDNESNMGSMLGSFMVVNGEVQAFMGDCIAVSMLKSWSFLDLVGESIDDWLFKVEQFFALDRIQNGSKINEIAIRLDGGALHWHKIFIKIKGKNVEWAEYKETIKCRFGHLAYDDPIVEMKNLKQTGNLQEYLLAFDSLLDKAQLSEG